MANCVPIWEHGSEFPWIDAVKSTYKPCVHPWSVGSVRFGSGRDAIRALLRHGASTLNWRRVFVPSFTCPEVVNAVVSEDLDAKIYLDDPRQAISPCHLGSKDALIVTNTFGMRSRWHNSEGLAGALIEDHTHDPWSDWAQASEADYCIASLRKTLPIPDGAMLWSPTGRSLPKQPMLTEFHQFAVSRKIDGMLLKYLYLAGCDVNKETYRSLLISGEERIATIELSDMHPVSRALIDNINTLTWRESRQDNYSILAKRLVDIPGIELITPVDTGSCPFSMILVCDDANIRESLRSWLIEHRIYPAVLWPLDSMKSVLSEASIELSRCILSLPCDGRYDSVHMEQVADVFLRFWDL